MKVRRSAGRRFRSTSTRVQRAATSSARSRLRCCQSRTGISRRPAEVNRYANTFEQLTKLAPRRRPDDCAARPDLREMCEMEHLTWPATAVRQLCRSAGPQAIRDSKDPAGADASVLPYRVWTAFTAGVRDGEFDWIIRCQDQRSPRVPARRATLSLDQPLFGTTPFGLAVFTSPDRSTSHLLTRR